MKRTLILFAFFLFTSPAALPAADTRTPRPNIIVILSDDMGYADIGVHGCKDIPTPNIDRIATSGVRFTDAYANGSFCTPTRAALMSCRYQHRYGIEDLANVSGPLPLVARSLPQRLREAGYVTGMVGKWHLGDKAGFTPRIAALTTFSVSSAVGTNTSSNLMAKANTTRPSCAIVSQSTRNAT